MCRNLFLFRFVIYQSNISIKKNPQTIALNYVLYYKSEFYLLRFFFRHWEAHIACTLSDIHNFNGQAFALMFFFRRKQLKLNARKNQIADAKIRNHTREACLLCVGQSVTCHTTHECRRRTIQWKMRRTIKILPYSSGRCIHSTINMTQNEINEIRLAGSFSWYWCAWV